MIDTMSKSLAILGTRGVPARHGGFETFAEHLSLYLVGRGWQVTVYCQTNGASPSVEEDEWRGVRRVSIPVSKEGAMGTVLFDWRAIAHSLAAAHPLILTLGYNTAAFCARYRLGRAKNIINMDGIEWKRDKWRPHERCWLWLNERLGCWFGNHLVADHPRIADHLATRVSRGKITTIPYGAAEILEAPSQPLASLGLEPGRFATVIARPEPENSILEIVRAFSRRPRGVKLVMLGNYDPANEFHAAVRSAASEEVLFPGAIYEKSVVESLRYHSRLYIHGHRVGGTNPSLVEALGAGSAVLAHDNHFNHWVAGNDAAYFRDEESCAKGLDLLLDDEAALRHMREASRERFRQDFTWEKVLLQYETLLLEWLP